MKIDVRSESGERLAMARRIRARLSEYSASMFSEAIFDDMQATLAETIKTYIGKLPGAEEPTFELRAGAEGNTVQVIPTNDAGHWVTAVWKHDEDRRTLVEAQAVLEEGRRQIAARICAENSEERERATSTKVAQRLKDDIKFAKLEASRLRRELDARRHVSGYDETVRRVVDALDGAETFWTVSRDRIVCDSGYDIALVGQRRSL